MILIALTSQIQYSDSKDVFIKCTYVKNLLQDLAINMVVALQPEFHSKQVIDEFVDEANLIRQQNRH